MHYMVTLLSALWKDVPWTEIQFPETSGSSRVLSMWIIQQDSSSSNSNAEKHNTWSEILLVYILYKILHMS